MNRLIFPVLFLVLIVPGLLLAGKPRVYFSYNQFYSLTDGPYIETYLQFDASSLAFSATNDNQYNATVNILMMLKHHDNIIDFRKYDLKSPSISDPLENLFAFIDQQRFAVRPDTFDLEIIISNSRQPDDFINHTERIIVQFDPNLIQLSSTQLVDKFERATQIGPQTKSGVNITPYVDNFYPSSINKLIFYQEIYNTEKVLGLGGPFLIQCFIEVFETSKALVAFNRFKRESAKPVNIVFTEFDISQLPSGNYNLVVEIKDKNNALLCNRKTFFQRSNPKIKLSETDFRDKNIAHTFVEKITNLDSLVYFVKALSPISSHSQRELANNLALNRNQTILQQYFMYFWEERNPLSPEAEWNKYYIELCKADAAFKTRVKRGYETDRGRVYLQYGPPNSITPSYNEPSAIPYEIWHYYTINGQRNKRFVFATRDLVTNDFDLIHSDMVGEILNQRWQLELHSTVLRGWDVDTETVEPHWGSRSRDYFLDPR